MPISANERPEPAVTGLNHITLAVADVGRSLEFYRDVLGFTVRALWADGAYLEAGSLWLCLSKDRRVRTAPHPDYTHIAFNVPDDAYERLRARIVANAVVWKENSSEGASVYFLDPDGHKLELHLGSLETRLEHYRARPGTGVEVFDREKPASAGSSFGTDVAPAAANERLRTSAQDPASDSWNPGCVGADR